MQSRSGKWSSESSAISFKVPTSATAMLSHQNLCWERCPMQPDDPSATSAALMPQMTVRSRKTQYRRFLLRDFQSQITYPSSFYHPSQLNISRPRGQLWAAVGAGTLCPRTGFVVQEYDKLFHTEKEPCFLRHGCPIPVGAKTFKDGRLLIPINFWHWRSMALSFW